MTTRGAGGGTARLLKERQLDRRKQDGQLPPLPTGGRFAPRRSASIRSHEPGATRGLVAAGPRRFELETWALAIFSTRFG